MFLLLLTSMFAAGLSVSRPTVKDCGGGRTLFTVNAVSLLPDIPIPNENVILHLEYTVPSGVVITGGESKFSYTYNFFPMSPTIEPLCRNVPCPLRPGKYVNNTVSRWPSGLVGSFTSTLQWKDETASPLLCVSIIGVL